MQDLAAHFYQNAFLAYHHYAEVKNDQIMGDNRDRREAINAAIAVYYLREHIPSPFQKSRAQLAAKCPDYDVLGDVVNAAKHNKLTYGTPQIATADKIYQTMVCTEYKDQGGEYSHCEKVVEAKLIDGSTRDLYEVLTNVINMWFEELHQIGAIDQRQPIELKRQGIVSRENAVSLVLQVTKGIRWEQHMRFQQYNYETHEIEPVDLSDCQDIIFTVREPPTFELELADDSGLKIARKVQLTLEQASKLEQIEDEIEQNRYLLQLAVDQGITAPMLAEHYSVGRDEED